MTFDKTNENIEFDQYNHIFVSTSKLTLQLYLLRTQKCQPLLLYFVALNFLPLCHNCSIKYPNMSHASFYLKPTEFLNRNLHLTYIY